MRYVSLFSGIEAATVAVERSGLGWEPMAFSEIEPFPCALLAEKYPDVPNLGDVRKIDWSEFVEEYGRPDVLVGGSPCQSFSIAGNRTGLDGASGLMWEYVRAVRELGERGLRWCVWENVPGALSSKKGEDFRCLLEALDESGFDCAWRVLDAQWFGVAQRRRRVWLVGANRDAFGDSATGRAAAVLFERNCLSGNSQPSREAWQGPSGASEVLSIGGDGPDPFRVIPVNTMVATRFPNEGRGTGMGVSRGGEAQFTLSTAHEHAVAYSRLRHNEHKLVEDENEYVVRRLTPLECERLQGFPDGYTNIGGKVVRDKKSDTGWRIDRTKETPDSPRYKALGNSWAVPCAQFVFERLDEVDKIAICGGVLKPCPFCGEQPEINEYHGFATPHYSVDCMNDSCPAYVGSSLKETKQEAIEAWNTRAEKMCKPEVEHHGDLILTRYPCCGYELKEYRYSPYPEVAFNNCPNCGAKVVK